MLCKLDAAFWNIAMTVETPPLYAHQKKTLAKLQEINTLWDMSDPGTGKTRVALRAFAGRRTNGGGRMLLVAPKSLLLPAWGGDAEAFEPALRIAFALAGGRERAFATGADVVGINTDGVKWLVGAGSRGRGLALTREAARLLRGFDTLAVDESSDFKHHASQRSKAARVLSRLFEFRELLGATPAPNSVVELWHQAFLLDGGASLGDSFYRFREQTQTPQRVGMAAGAVQWRDRPGIRGTVAPLIERLVVRHRFEDCLDIPPHAVRTVFWTPPPKLMRQCRELEATATLALKSGTMTAANAAVLRGKLLQTASGAVYDGPDGAFEVLDRSRYELVADLVREDPDPTVVFYSWKHQREELEAALAKASVPCAAMGAGMSPKARQALVARFQAGALRCLLLHPATGAHGLTLTAGRRTVLASPFDRADWLVQARHRIWRAGQSKRTETVLVQALGTVEGRAYAALDGKTRNLADLLGMLEET